MKKLIGAVIATAMLLTGCGGDKAATEDRIDINLSLVFQQTELLTKEMSKVADNIRERTNGSVNIRVFPGGELPVYKDNLEQVLTNANWIAVEDLTYLGDYIPDFTALAGPMLYDSQEEYLAMMQTDLVKGLKQQAEDVGIKVLSLDYIVGFRHMIADKPIKSFDDMRGMRVRVPPSQLYIRTLSAMGADPAGLPFPETYAAVQQGVIDGLEGSVLSMHDTSIYEVTGKMSRTKHFLGTVGVYISPKVWEQFTEEQQQIISEEFAAGAISNNAELVKVEEENIRKLKELGITFHEVDLTEFRERISVVYEQFPEWSEDIYQSMMKELKAIREEA